MLDGGEALGAAREGRVEGGTADAERVGADGAVAGLETGESVAGSSVLASLMLPNNESRLMLPNGVCKVSVTVPGVVTPSAVTSGVAV